MLNEERHRFMTRKGNIVNDQSNSTDAVENEIINNREVLTFILWDYNGT